MKRAITIIFCIISLTSCKYLRGDHCNNTVPVVGTYENIYDKDAKNILIIKENGTFEQVFTKEKIIKRNTGSWRFFDESCNIYLDSLKLLHELSESNKRFFKQSGIHRLNNIVFVEGLGYEFNFYRIKN